MPGAPNGSMSGTLSLIACSVASERVEVGERRRRVDAGLLEHVLAVVDRARLGEPRHGPRALLARRPASCSRCPRRRRPLPPISSTRSLRSVNPPSAAKNGTCVVPACVMSGPSPETAALRMRSNWTSQPTSCTSTFTPVLAVNGATIFCRSSFGLGEFGIVQSVSVTPFCSCARPARRCRRRGFGRCAVVVAAAGHEGRGGEHERDRRRDDRRASWALRFSLLRLHELIKNGFGDCANEYGAGVRLRVSPPSPPERRWSRGPRARRGGSATRDGRDRRRCARRARRRPPRRGRACPGAAW